MLYIIHSHHTLIIPTNILNIPTTTLTPNIPQPITCDSFAKLFVDFSPGSTAALQIYVPPSSVDDAQPKVCISPAFYDLFGLNSAELCDNVRETGGGFLPWGLDVLAGLVASDRDLMALVQIIAIKFSSTIGIFVFRFL